MYHIIRQVLGSSGLCHINKTDTGSFGLKVMHRTRSGPVVDCVVSIGLVLVQDRTVGQDWYCGSIGPIILGLVLVQ